MIFLTVSRRRIADDHRLVLRAAVFESEPPETGSYLLVGGILVALLATWGVVRWRRRT
jgi:LPXTG-motif cell wall-anchored protein